MALQAPICFTVMEIVPNAEDRHFRTRPLRATPGETIAHLRKMSAESFNKSSTDIQLVYYGKPLDDGLTFEAAGIREGSTVLVYPKMNQQRSVGDKQEIRKKIVKAITRLYKSKYLYMLAKTELLNKVHYDMPDLDTGTFAVLQSSRLLVKYLMPKYSDELDEIVDKYPQLGDALMKAIDWAPSMLRVVPPEDPNMFSMEAASDGDGDGDSESESLDGGPMSRGRISSGDPRISFTGGSSATYTTQPVLPRNAPQPGPSQEPQPGPSRAPQRGVTGPMLQAALEAAYSSQAQVATRTFKVQLDALKDMGFADEKASIAALVKSGGDVDMAVNLLLQN